VPLPAETVAALAAAAGLKVEPARLEALGAALEAALVDADRLRELDLDGVEPLVPPAR
jgi:Asp-tRNA(Asn)/Glu-tRNA(Gln) amidotransferase C subunit